MKDPAAFQATYADWKLIRGRKVVQVIFEVPLEGADAAYRVVGGMPDPSTSTWFAIARLTAPTKEAVPTRQPDMPDAPPAGGSSKKSWHEMSPAQQAGLLCTDKNFHRYLCERESFPIELADAEYITDAVRSICGVQSRKQIIPDTPAATIWRNLVADYRVWERALV